MWKRIRLYLYLLLPLTARLFGQQPQQFVTVQPDCLIFFNFTATGNSPTSPNNGLDNRTLGCTTWQISYSNSGFSAVTLTLQSAPDVSGAPGTYVTFAGTILVGINPNTATTQAYTQFTGANPWVRVRLSVATGTGVVSGAAYGWRIPSANNAPTAGTTDVNLVKVGGSAIAIGQAAMAASLPVAIASNQSSIPVTFSGTQTVQGTAAAGAAPSGNPVQLGGTDGTNMQVVKVDTNGDQQVVNSCTLHAAFNLSGSGNTQIIALSAAKQIIVCSLIFATGTPEDIKFTEGTGTNCGTGTADASGLYKSISAYAHDALGLPYTSTAGDALCLNQANSQALGGTAWYRYQ